MRIVKCVAALKLMRRCPPLFAPIALAASSLNWKREPGKAEPVAFSVLCTWRCRLDCAELLPDFPDIKRDAERLLYFHLHTQIAMIPVPEGAYTTQLRPDGSVEDTKMEKAQGNAFVSTDPETGLTLENVMKSIDDVAHQMAKQEAQMLYRRLGGEDVAC